MVEKVLPHECVVALLVVALKADILIHVEGDNIGKGDISFPIEPDQLSIGSQRRRSCGKSKYKRSICIRFKGPDSIGNIPCSPKGQILIIVLDDDSHCSLLFTSS